MLEWVSHLLKTNEIKNQPDSPFNGQSQKVVIFFLGVLFTFSGVNSKFSLCYFTRPARIWVSLCKDPWSGAS